MDSQRPKYSPDEVKQHITRIQEITDKVKKGKKDDQSVTVITPEEIDRKLRRVNSPMIVSQGWSNNIPVNGTVNYSVGIYNPDPTSASNVFAHVFIGSGNVDPVTGTFLLNVDPRFPRLTQPDVFGLTIASHASASLSFAIKVPANAELTNYLGNTCLMQFNWHDIGTYLDRSVFVFKVV